MRYRRTKRIKRRGKVNPITFLFYYLLGMIIGILLLPLFLPFSMAKDIGKKRRRY